MTQDFMTVFSLKPSQLAKTQNVRVSRYTV